MNKKKIQIIGAIILAVIWMALAIFAWVKPPKQFSDAERRPLEQFPELSTNTILSNSFMSDFEDYTLDQFPFRDAFRQMKSFVHYYILNQSDNNDIYIADGYAAKLEYPLNHSSIKNATERFNFLYDTLMKDTDVKIYLSIIPDKSYYLAEQNRYLAMDYQELFDAVKSEMPWAKYVDITKQLKINDYYKTDTHWRQECIIPAAQTLCEAMGATAPQPDNFAVKKIERPFYGVYYGQAALPMEAESIYTLSNELLQQCKVYSHEDGKYSKIYNEKMLESKDLYDIYLSGAKALLTIENPQAKTEKELIIFRDSFGSSITPLLIQEYKTITLIDIRYISSSIVKKFVEFNNQDVLFLYSTLVLNDSSTLK